MTYRMVSMFVERNFEMLYIYRRVKQIVIPFEGNECVFEKKILLNIAFSVMLVY